MQLYVFTTVGPSHQSTVLIELEQILWGQASYKRSNRLLLASQAEPRCLAAGSSSPFHLTSPLFIYRPAVESSATLNQKLRFHLTLNSIITIHTNKML